MPDLLVPLNQAAALHSKQLTELIRQRTKLEHVISFADFMQLALYAPGLGYYSAGATKFGEQGDFITAPELSPLFSRCLARQCQQILSTLSDAVILELGAGSGIMAVELLLELEQLESLPTAYFILEVSADLRQRQQELILARFPQFASKVHWLDGLPASFSGIILANEVLDAMPVHKFSLSDGELCEIGVAWQHEQFIWQPRVPSSQLTAAVAELSLNHENYESEINLAVKPWLASLSACLQQGLILLIDYGFTQAEYYHPQRDQGTIMCHYQHHAHSDPLILPGLQDITAHVDFTAVAQTGDEQGLQVAGFTSQANFLLSCGIAELLQEIADPVAQFNASQQVKRLLLPSEMGELFKVLALTREFDQPLLGFTIHDLRYKL